MGFNNTNGLISPVSNPNFMGSDDSELNEMILARNDTFEE
jgi:hypothetical protein